MLGTAPKRIYLNITDGKIVRRTETGVQRYDYLEGHLEKIYQREREFRGEKVPYWYLDMMDASTGDLYTLGLSATSGVWRSIIFALGTPFDPTKPIRINPYKRGEYDRVSVYSGGERLDWISDLPPVAGDKGTIERTLSIQKREDFISSLVEQINRRIESSKTPQETPKRGRSRRVPGSIYLEDI